MVWHNECEYRAKSIVEWNKSHGHTATDLKTKSKVNNSLQVVWESKSSSSRGKSRQELEVTTTEEILEDDDINVDLGTVKTIQIGNMHSQHLHCLLGILPAWVLTFHSFKKGTIDKDNFLQLLSISGAAEDELGQMTSSKLFSIANALQNFLSKFYGIQIR
jgi:hypothetical protein